MDKQINKTEQIFRDKCERICAKLLFKKTKKKKKNFKDLTEEYIIFMA